MGLYDSALNTIDKKDIYKAHNSGLEADMANYVPKSNSISFAQTPNLSVGTGLTGNALEALENQNKQTEDDRLHKNTTEIKFDNEFDSIEKLNKANSKDLTESTVKSNTSIDGDLRFQIPQYGVQDFINERALWQKGVHNLTGEPGWFYFKVFFHFSEPRGLFGGIMDNTIPNTSAIRYLFGIRDFYTYDKLYDRILALCRFTYTLSYINSVSPWFFIGINNLNQLNALQSLDMSKEHSIDLVCNGESIDMRLNTLLDMYKYACYDDMNMKEILPENLRKFDMSIIIMNVPIKYFQTGMMTSGQDSTMSQIGKNGDTALNKAISGMNKFTNFMNGSDTKTFNYKSIMGRNNSLEDSLSFQLYTLKNCEIDPVSFSNYLPSSMNNSAFSKLGNTAIKIKYDRVYKHTFNEWQQMMTGSTGIYYDGTIDKYINASNLTSALQSKSTKYKNDNILNAQQNRIKAIKDSIYNRFFNKDTDAYKALIDFSETVIEDSLINTDDPTFLGNIGINYDANDYDDMWLKTRDNVNKFFTKPFKF